MDRVTIASAAAVVVLTAAAAVPVYVSATADAAPPQRAAAGPVITQLPPMPGHEPVIPPSPSASLPAASLPSLTAEATRAPVKPSQRPAATRAPEAAAKPSTARPPAATTAPRPETRTVISGYRVCEADPQPCIDGGSLTLYGRDYGPGILAGHNYDGFQWLSRLPVGRVVQVTSGPVAGRYEVTGHLRLNRQSGALPPFGGADLVLQSCEGSGTGFSLLRLAPG